MSFRFEEVHQISGIWNWAHVFINIIRLAEKKMGVEEKVHFFN